MTPWAVGSGLYGAVLAFGIAAGAAIALMLILEAAFIAYDRFCWWCEERERKR